MRERSLLMLQSRILEYTSEAIRQELNDPRLERAMPSVTRVKLAPDLSVAHVYISIFGEEGAQRACWQGLQSGRGRLQRFVGDRLRTRTTPQLILHLDDSLKKAADVLQAIDETTQEDAEGRPAGEAAAGSDEPPSADASPKANPEADRA